MGFFFLPGYGMEILLVAALLPPIILMKKVYDADKIEPEPPALIWKLFFSGCISVIPAAILEMIAEVPLSAVTNQGLELVLENFLGVALIEEGCKHFFLRKQTWNDENFNFRYDAMVYAVAVSLGFAAAENVKYVFSYGLSTALVRAVTSIPGHCIFGIYMGYFYGFAKYDEARDRVDGKSFNMAMSLIIPILLHGFYDYCLSSGNQVLAVLYWVYVIVLDILAFRTVNKYSEEDRPIY